MNYSSIEQILKKSECWKFFGVCLPDRRKGEIIYHPRQKLIYTDLYQENNIEAAGYEDGSTEEIFPGGKTPCYGKDGQLYRMEDRQCCANEFL